MHPQVEDEVPPEVPCSKVSLPTQILASSLPKEDSQGARAHRAVCDGQPGSARPFLPMAVAWKPSSFAVSPGGHLKQENRSQGSAVLPIMGEAPGSWLNPSIPGIMLLPGKVMGGCREARGEKWGHHLCTEHSPCPHCSAHHMHSKTGHLSFLPKVCEWQGPTQNLEEPNLGRVAEKA